MTNKPKLPPMPEPADKRGTILRNGLLHYCPVYTEDQVRQAMLDAIALNATGDDDAALECTCAAKDMPFGRCCKLTPNKCKWCGHDIHAHDRQYGCAEDGCDCETPRNCVPPSPYPD